MRTFVTIGTICVLVAAGTGRADVPKKKDVPKNIKLLQTSTVAKVRADAATELGHLGAIRKSYVLEAIDPLLSALKNDKMPVVRRAAAEALGKINPDNKVAVKPLIEALKDPDMGVRIGAATALGNLGPDATEAIDTLRQIREEAMKTFKDQKKPDKKTRKKLSKKMQMEMQQQRQLAQAAGMALQSIGGRRRK
jgi:hypothetical protein